MPAEWDITTIAWHPSPALRHTYAIVNRAGNVHIIDGSPHRQLGMRIGRELAPGLCGDFDLRRSQPLRWSPDGSQLAVLADTTAAIITFAEA